MFNYLKYGSILLNSTLIELLNSCYIFTPPPRNFSSQICPPIMKKTSQIVAGRNYPTGFT